MNNVWTWRQAILETSLSATTKHVLMVISTHMNDMGEGCYPSTKRISNLCSLSERSVCTHIQKAIEAGWLSSGVHGYSGKGWARNEYKAEWPQKVADWKEGIPRTVYADEQTKDRARRYVANALSAGRMKKEACMVCGKDAEAHHTDYTKRDDIIWLCRGHHIEFHSWERRTEPLSDKTDGAEHLACGTEPNADMALKDVHSILPIDTSIDTSHDGFEGWWELYGKKGSRYQAEAQWKRLRCSKNIPAINEGTLRYLRSGRVRRGYKLDGQRFLRDRGWENEWEGVQTNPETPTDQVPF